jgi:ferritin-like protein
MTTNQPWPWPPETDALLAAPATHRVLLENDQIRVLEVVIDAGTREPEHTHRAPSVMIADGPARIRYYAGGTLQSESPAVPAAPSGPRVRWLEPEGPHSVENIDQHRYHAIRIELKESTMTSLTPAPSDVTGTLDSFYCHNLVVAIWADAVANRLEGMAIYLLSDELAEVAEHAREAAGRLADRIGDLDGAVTADPRQLIDRAPGDIEYTIPDCSDPRAIVSYAVQRLDIIIAAYQAFLDTIRGRDDVSFALVVDLLAAETHRRADARAALAQPPA